MKLRNLLGAAAIATFGLVTASHAALNTITDAGGDAIFVPAGPVPTLTIDDTAVDVGGTFDTESVEFNFSGAGNASEVISMVNDNNAVLSVGNLNEDIEFSTGRLFIDDGSGPVLLVDFKNDPDTDVIFAVSGAFDLILDFVDAPGDGKTGTFDFTISAIPLPAGLALLLTGLGGLALVGRRRRQMAA